MADPMAKAQVTHVQVAIEPVLAQAGFELVDVELAGGVLRVFVDRAGGIDLDAVAEATTAVSSVLDDVDPVPGGRYTLEVSSPGLERPLRRPDHFARFVGTTVAVKLLATVAGERRRTGRLDAADDDGIVVDGAPIPYGDIDKAHTVFEWGGAPKPGAARSSKSATARKKASTP